MTCFRPLRAFRRPGGGVVFNRSCGFVDRPVELPCGQCIGCRVQRAQEWTTRLLHEKQFHEKSCMVTLTYDQEHLPEDFGLSVRDWQLFAKRVRRHEGPFRFFHCGEYGPENLRPHYHAILFGHDFARDRAVFKENAGRRTYVSESLSRLWSKGFCTVSDLTRASASYVARYCVDKLTGGKGELAYTRYDSATGRCWNVKPPYVTMSRRPGIGSKWFDEYKDDVYPSDFVVHDGRKFRPPSFYDRKLPEGELKVLKDKRRRVAGLHKEDQTPDRLYDREKVAAARLSSLRREV